MRHAFLRALVLFGVALVVITESLSLFSLLRPIPLALCWIAAILILARHVRPSLPRPRLDSVTLAAALSIAAILTLTAITAAFSPPNSADAMAYHLPRVVYWAEQSSVRFFPTPYLNQIMLQPLAEYFTLHTYMLSGSDRFATFVPWFASLASIVGVSAIARRLGASPAGQAVAALFCATLPAGILASSGAKNDYWMAMWLVAAVYFAFEFVESERLRDALLLGAAIGLALLTKATAYLFVPWPLAAIAIAQRVKLRRLLPGAVAALAVALAINTPQYVRNYNLSGSPLGFDSAQGNGYFRWRNDSFGWKQTTSNVLRNLSEQLGARGDAWNQRVYRIVLAAHARLGIRPDDPDTTWRGSAYAPPRNANHEANAPNRWHLLILVAVAIACLFARRHPARALYALSLLCAFIAFCAYLKWQPFLARLLLPLFILGAPLAGLIDLRKRAWIVQLPLCLFLLANARLPLLENWVRPLRGPSGIFHTPRDTQYFADMSQWNNRASYEASVDLLAHSRCDTIGIDITNLQLEYPLQALLRERRPNIQFVHTGVENASSRYRPPIDRSPCAIACLDCSGDTARLALYADFPRRFETGKFVILTTHP